MYSMFATVLSLLVVTTFAKQDTRPNIVFVFADDWGFNDWGYSGSSYGITPFIDNLANKESLILTHNYVQSVCSPTRASFLTGRYPHNLGLQNLMFNPDYEVSLTRQASVLSEELKDAGYSTHIVGKWHLGMQSWEYTPTYRGFESFNGFYGGWTFYSTHKACVTNNDGFLCYYDLRNNEEEALHECLTEETYGVWWQRDSTLTLLEELEGQDKPFFLYLAWQASHDPSEAPQDYYDMFSDLPWADDDDSDSGHQYNLAQSATLDDSMEAVVNHMKSLGMWDNTLLIFSSDNGGQYGKGDNYPLRGYKNTSFEGGVRSPGFVSGGYLNSDRYGQTLDDTMVHVVDWYPTILDAIDRDVGYTRSKKLYNSDELDTRFDNMGDLPLDGQSVWKQIQFGETAGEDVSIYSRELVIGVNNIYCDLRSCGAIRIGKYKYLRGSNVATLSKYDDAYLWGRTWAKTENMNDNTIGVDSLFGCENDWESVVNEDSKTCYDSEDGCLFDIESDPCEYYNLASDDSGKYHGILAKMQKRLNYHYDGMTSALIIQDNKLDFKYMETTVSDNNFWVPFQKYSDVKFENELMSDYIKIYFSDNDDEEFKLDASNKGFFTELMGDSKLIMVLIAVLCAMGLVILCVTHYRRFGREQKTNNYGNMNKNEKSPLLVLEN